MLIFFCIVQGNRNFGIVLGEYVGTAFEGLSGGGGAVNTLKLFMFYNNFNSTFVLLFFFLSLKVNNGKFLGNFLGTVIASLSAVC